MPANVSLNIRPMVTAGFANDVDDVNQYAAPMYAPTAAGATAARPLRTRAKTSKTNPVVATTSPSHSGAPLRCLVDSSIAGKLNIRLAKTEPATAPATWATTYTPSSACP